MANMLGIVGIVVTGVAFIIGILSTAIVHWSTIELANNAEMKIGLFQTCTTAAGVTQCDKVEAEGDDKTNVDVVKAMMILGIILSVGSLVCGILVLFVMKEMKILYFVAGGVDIVAGLCFMIAMAVYTDKIHDPDVEMKYGACFALSIVAWILAWVGGALFVVAKMMDKE